MLIKAISVIIDERGSRRLESLYEQKTHDSFRVLYPLAKDRVTERMHLPETLLGTVKTYRKEAVIQIIGWFEEDEDVENIKELFRIAIGHTHDNVSRCARSTERAFQTCF